MFFLLSSVALAAPDPGAIQRRISANDYEGARRRCEKWEAENPEADPALREVCAKADWPLAEARDTARVWQAYCDEWVGTEWAEVAVERLAGALLRELRSPASEEDLLNIAAQYPDTRAAQDAQEQAADAAIRDASSADLALRAAQRYPGHPGLPPLVERYPEHFVTVLIQEDRTIEATIDPPIAVPAYMQPMPVWVARWPGGHTTPWQEVATTHLTEAGLSAQQIPIAGSGPPLPLCLLPGQPEGFHAAIEVRVGAGRVYRPVPWDEGCGLDAAPVIMTVSGEVVSGLAMGPNQRADLTARSLDGRRHTRAFLTTQPGPPQLLNGHLFSPVDRLWLVTPLNGGPPWLTDRAPSRDAVPLQAGLTGSSPPPGSQLVSEGGQLVLRRQGSEDWPLPPGEARFLSPLLSQILGISGPGSQPQGAPALQAQVPWRRDGTAIRPEPPDGGRTLALTALSELDTQQAQLRVESAGVNRSRMEVRDAWTVDIDRDNVVEVIFRARLDEQGALLILDVHPDLGNRLFLFNVEDAAPEGAEAAAPFAFTYGGHPYFAWAGANGGASFIEVVRYDGQSFRSERIRMTP